MTRHNISPLPQLADSSDCPREISEVNRSFVTAGRITMATRYADEIAARKSWLTASECAGEAVRQIFGKWILDHTAAIRPQFIPLYFRLIATVENRLGLHRRAEHDGEPMHPALAAALPKIRAEARITANSAA